MTAATRNRVREFVDGLTPLALRVSFIAMATFALLGGAYCAGKSSGVASVQHATRDSLIKIQVDTIKVITEHYKTDTIRVTVTKHEAAVAVATFDSAAKGIEAIADTASVIPASLVLPEITACRTALAAQDTAYAAQTRALLDMTADRNAQRTRADLIAANCPRVPRFGFRSGLVAGIGAAALLVHFLR